MQQSGKKAPQNVGTKAQTVKSPKQGDGMGGQSSQRKGETRGYKGRALRNSEVSNSTYFTQGTGKSERIQATSGTQPNTQGQAEGTGQKLDPQHDEWQNVVHLGTKGASDGRLTRTGERSEGSTKDLFLRLGSSQGVEDTSLARLQSSGRCIDSSNNQCSGTGADVRASATAFALDNPTDVSARVSKISALKQGLRTFNQERRLAAQVGRDVDLDELDDWGSIDREATISASPARNSSVEKPFRNLVELRRDGESSRKLSQNLDSQEAEHKEDNTALQPINESGGDVVGTDETLVPRNEHDAGVVAAGTPIAGLGKQGTLGGKAGLESAGHAMKDDVIEEAGEKVAVSGSLQEEGKGDGLVQQQSVVEAPGQALDHQGGVLKNQGEEGEGAEKVAQEHECCTDVKQASGEQDYGGDMQGQVVCGDVQPFDATQHSIEAHGKHGQGATTSSSEIASTQNIEESEVGVSSDVAGGVQGQNGEQNDEYKSSQQVQQDTNSDVKTINALEQEQGVEKASSDQVVTQADGAVNSMLTFPLLSVLPEHSGSPETYAQAQGQTPPPQASGKSSSQQVGQPFDKRGGEQAPPGPHDVGQLQLLLDGKFTADGVANAATSAEGWNAREQQASQGATFGVQQTANVVAQAGAPTMLMIKSTPVVDRVQNPDAPTSATQGNQLYGQSPGAQARSTGAQGTPGAAAGAYIAQGQNDGDAGALKGASQAGSNTRVVVTTTPGVDAAGQSIATLNCVTQPGKLIRVVSIVGKGGTPLSAPAQGEGGQGAQNGAQAEQVKPQGQVTEVNEVAGGQGRLNNIEKDVGKIAALGKESEGHQAAATTPAQRVPSPSLPDDTIGQQKWSKGAQSGDVAADRAGVSTQDTSCEQYQSVGKQQAPAAVQLSRNPQRRSSSRTGVKSEHDGPHVVAQSAVTVAVGGDKLGGVDKRMKRRHGGSATSSKDDVSTVERCSFLVVWNERRIDMHILQNDPALHVDDTRIPFLLKLYSGEGGGFVVQGFVILPLYLINWVSLKTVNAKFIWFKTSRQLESFKDIKVLLNKREELSKSTWSRFFSVRIAPDKFLTVEKWLDSLKTWLINSSDFIFQLHEQYKSVGWLKHMIDSAADADIDSIPDAVDNPVALPKLNELKCKRLDTKLVNQKSARQLGTAPGQHQSGARASLEKRANPKYQCDMQQQEFTNVSIKLRGTASDQVDWLNDLGDNMTSVELIMGDQIRSDRVANRNDGNTKNNQNSKAAVSEDAGGVPAVAQSSGGSAHNGQVMGAAPATAAGSGGGGGEQELNGAMKDCSQIEGKGKVGSHVNVDIDLAACSDDVDIDLGSKSTEQRAVQGGKGAKRLPSTNVNSDNLTHQGGLEAVQSQGAGSQATDVTHSQLQDKGQSDHGGQEQQTQDRRSQGAATEATQIIQSQNDGGEDGAKVEESVQGSQPQGASPDHTEANPRQSQGRQEETAQTRQDSKSQNAASDPTEAARSLPKDKLQHAQQISPPDQHTHENQACGTPQSTGSQGPTNAPDDWQQQQATCTAVPQGGQPGCDVGSNGRQGAAQQDAAAAVLAPDCDASSGEAGGGGSPGGGVQNSGNCGGEGEGGKGLQQVQGEQAYGGKAQRDTGVLQSSLVQQHGGGGVDGRVVVEGQGGGERVVQQQAEKQTVGNDGNSPLELAGGLVAEQAQLVQSHAVVVQNSAQHDESGANVNKNSGIGIVRNVNNGNNGSNDDDDLDVQLQQVLAMGGLNLDNSNTQDKDGADSQHESQQQVDQSVKQSQHQQTNKQNDVQQSSQVQQQQQQQQQLSPDKQLQSQLQESHPSTTVKIVAIENNGQEKQRLQNNSPLKLQQLHVNWQQQVQQPNTTPGLKDHDQIRPQSGKRQQAKDKQAAKLPYLQPSTSQEHAHDQTRPQSRKKQRSKDKQPSAQAQHETQQLSSKKLQSKDKSEVQDVSLQQVAINSQPLQPSSSSQMANRLRVRSSHKPPPDPMHPPYVTHATTPNHPPPTTASKQVVLTDVGLVGQAEQHFNTPQQPSMKLLQRLPSGDGRQLQSPGLERGKLKRVDVQNTANCFELDAQLVRSTGREERGQMRWQGGGSGGDSGSGSGGRGQKRARSPVLPPQDGGVTSLDQISEVGERQSVGQITGRAAAQQLQQQQYKAQQQQQQQQQEDVGVLQQEQQQQQQEQQQQKQQQQQQQQLQRVKGKVGRKPGRKPKNGTSSQKPHVAKSSKAREVEHGSSVDAKSPPDKAQSLSFKNPNSAQDTQSMQQVNNDKVEEALEVILSVAGQPELQQDVLKNFRLENGYVEYTQLQREIKHRSIQIGKARSSRGKHAEGTQLEPAREVDPPISTHTVKKTKTSDPNRQVPGVVHSSGKSVVKPVKPPPGLKQGKRGRPLKYPGRQAQKSNAGAQAEVAPTAPAGHSGSVPQAFQEAQQAVLGFPSSGQLQGAQDTSLDKMYAQYYGSDSIWSVDKLNELRQLLTPLPLYNQKMLNEIPLGKGTGRASSDWGDLHSPMEVLCSWLEVDRKMEVNEGGRRVIKAVQGWVNHPGTRAAYGRAGHGGAFRKAFEMLNILDGSEGGGGGGYGAQDQGSKLVGRLPNGWGLGGGWGSIQCCIVVNSEL